MAREEFPWVMSLTKQESSIREVGLQMEGGDLDGRCCSNCRHYSLCGGDGERKVKPNHNCRKLVSMGWDREVKPSGICKLFEPND